MMFFDEEPIADSTVVPVRTDYKGMPVLMNAIPCGQRVRGVTVLFDEIFLVRRWNPSIEVYDTKKFSLKRTMALDESGEPWDMTSSAKFSCIYIADLSRSIHRVEVKVKGDKTTQWPLSFEPAGISVTRDGARVVVTGDKAQKIGEFTTHGELVREIRLNDSIVNPSHAVQLMTGHFAVSHGCEDDVLHRVCIVDVDGRIVQSFGSLPGSDTGQLDTPVRLAVDRNGFIMVADRNNKRVLLLTPEMDGVRQLIPPRDIETDWDAADMCLDDALGRLYLAENEWKNREWKQGEVRIFDVREKKRAVFPNSKFAALTKVIPSGQRVRAVTVMFDEVFVLHRWKPEIEVYDADTFKVRRSVALQELGEAWDMTSSETVSCVYVSDLGRSVHRIEVSDKATQWPVNDEPAGLSVTLDGSNVLVTCDCSRKIIEYTTHGQLVRSITLQEDIQNPSHAVQLTIDEFVVCHGLHDDPLNGVAVVDAEGKPISYFGGPPGPDVDQVDTPLRLAVNKQGFILVADRNNKRVLLLSSTFEDITQVIPPRGEDTTWDAIDLCLEETRGRLYLAENDWQDGEWRNGEVRVFQVGTNLSYFTS